MEPKRRSNGRKNILKGSEIRSKKYYDYDDFRYKGIIDIRPLHDSDNEDYYKPRRIGNAFSSNCIEYLSNGDKDKILSIKECLLMIRLHLNDLIDKHYIVCFYYVTYEFELVMLGSLAKWLSVRLRTKWLWVRVPLQSHKHYTREEWQIQLAIVINFISPKDSEKN